MRPMKTKKIKIGIPAIVNRSSLPTLRSKELSDYHAFNTARIVGRQCDRVCLQWQDGHKAWFDQEAIIPIFQ